MTLDLDAIEERAKAMRSACESGYYHANKGAILEATGFVLALAEEVRHGNFFRDRFAERLSLVETAVVELACALNADPAYDPNHWRHHAESALDLCRRATVSREPAEEAT